MGILALIGLGSNLGDRKATLDAAVASLAEVPGCVVRSVSSYHETRPAGGPAGQGRFLNAAAAVETSSDALELLYNLQQIETRMGRVRTLRWGERTLDLDLLLFGSQVIDTGPVSNRVFGGQTTALSVPHPRMAVRRFVLAPLAEIAPEAIDPLTDRTVAALLAHLDRRPSYVAISESWGGIDPARFRALQADLPATGLMLASEVQPILSDLEFSSQTQRLDRPPWRTAVNHFEEWLSKVLVALGPGSWRDGPPPDRWLVSDFWFDDLFPSLPVPEAIWPEFRSKLLDVRTRILTPTFVIARPGSASWFSVLRRRSRWPNPLGEVPVLEVDGSDPEAALSEIQAACVASRGG